MIDIQLLRTHAAALEKKLQTKAPEISLKKAVEIDEKIRKLKTSSEELKAARNALSEQIGQKMRSKEPVDALKQEVNALSQQNDALETELAQAEQALKEQIEILPNLPMDDVLVAEDPKDNVVIKTWGEVPTFSFPIKHHLELNEKLHLFDFERGAKVSGSGFPIYVGMGAQLEWALLNYMLDFHKKNGFTQVIPPLLVKEETIYGSGQLPKFANQVYKLNDDGYNKLYLIPTSEVPLNGMHYDEIIDEELLPIKYAAYTPCFRREAGAPGTNERGLIRIHQFNKVEMFCFTTPEQSSEMFDQMVRYAEQLLEGLGLHYRSMKLVTGDMSFAAAKTVDIEVWLPGQNGYKEVSSVSNCTDFQSRRSKIRCKKRGEKKPRLLHTLNGSGLATSRVMVALLEQYQQEDGSVLIPEVLQPYLGGKTRL